MIPQPVFAALLLAALAVADNVEIPPEQQAKAAALHLEFQELRVRNADGKIFLKARNAGAGPITSLSLTVECFTKKGTLNAASQPFKARLASLAPGEVWKLDRYGLAVRGCVLEDLAGTVP